MARFRSPSFWLLMVAMIALISWPVIARSPYAREQVFVLLMYLSLASSLNIILGYTGYVSFGHIVFFGIGGYVGFFLIHRYNWHMIPAAIAGGIAAALVAFLLGSAILRLRGAYFAIATIGVNEAVKALVRNLSFLGGSTGMYFDFEVYKTYGGPGNALWLSYYSLAALALIILTTSYVVRNSKFGLGLMSIREDEDAATVLGVDSARYKTWAFTLSAFFPGIVGAIFFFKNGNIEPGDAFRLFLSIESIVIIMLGGFGTVLGPVVGAIVYERLRGLLLVNPLLKNLHLAISGVLLLIIVLFVSVGIVGYLRQRFPVLRRYLI